MMEMQGLSQYVWMDLKIFFGVVNKVLKQSYQEAGGFEFSEVFFQGQEEGRLQGGLYYRGVKSSRGGKVVVKVRSIGFDFFFKFLSLLLVQLESLGVNFNSNIF